jgi:hypothetical protein
VLLDPLSERATSHRENGEGLFGARSCETGMELSNTLHGVKERVAGDRRFLLALSAVASALSLLFFNSEQRRVALPILVIVNVAFVLMASIWGREDGEPVPLFEIGTIYCAALTLYSLVPFLNYLLAGMKWTALSDTRLLAYDAPPAEIGRFAWNYVVYLSSFAAVYLWARGKPASQKRVAVIDDSPPLAIVVLPLVALLVYFYLLNTVWGVDASPGYSKISDTMLNLKRLPLVVYQISSHLRGILLILKIALLILLFERWEAKRWSAVLCLWLALETAHTILNLGARFETALLLLSALLCYHRFVKPIRLSQAVAAGCLFIAGFQIMGMARNYALKGNRPVPSLTFRSVASATNEFQSIFATAYHLDQMKKAGQLENVPAQLYVSDFLMPVPQQLLPVKKIEPAEWYLEVSGIEGRTGYMFGVIAQSVVGFGLLELALRGALVGVLFGWAQRYYARRSSRFLPTLLYIWLCVWSYYTFRASTFYLLSPAIYRVLPVVALIYFGVRLKGRLRRNVEQDRPAL